MAGPLPGDEGPVSRAELRGGAIVLLLLVAIFHAPVLHNGFVYDDSWTIVRNPILPELGNLFTLLGSGPARDGIPDAGRPTLLATEMIDHALWRQAAAGYHLQNLVWHYGVTVLFLVLGVGLIGTFTLPFFAAGVFAVHPLLSEPVAVINYREDLLATFFVLAALGLLTRARTAVGKGRAAALRAGAVASLLVGLFAKESAMMAPILLAVVDVCRTPSPVRTVLRRRWSDYAMLGAACVAVFAWRWMVMGDPGVVTRAAEIPTAHLDRVRTMVHAAWILVRGIGQLCLPIGLSPEYVEHPVGTRSLLLGLLSALALGIGCVLAYRKRARHPWIAIGLIGCVVAYIPTSGIVPISNLRADRYMYLPAVPFLLGATSMVLPLAGRIRWLTGPPLFDVPRAWLAMGAIFVLLGTLTLGQTKIWRNDVALWTSAVATAPTSPRAWSALGEARLRSGGRTLEALEAARESLRLNPTSGHTRELLGLIYMIQGDLQRALREFEQALSLGVMDRAELLNNIGYCELQLKKFEAALVHFEAAAALARRYDRPLLNASRAHEKMGDRPRAISTARRLVERVPESVDAWKQLGSLLDAAGDREGALGAYRRAAKLVGNDPFIHQAVERLRAPETPASPTDAAAASGEAGRREVGNGQR